MKNIKEIVNNIDLNNGVSDLEVKCVSIKAYYAELKKQGRLRDMLRLRYIMHYYPKSVLEKISFDSLKLCIENPGIVTLSISNDRDWMYTFEAYAIEKSGMHRTFLLKHFYEYFKI